MYVGCGAGRKLTPAAARLVLRAFLAAKQTDKAIALFRELQAAGVELVPSTYTDLIACVCDLSGAVPWSRS